MTRWLLGIAAISMAFGSAVAPASANSVQINWFAVSPSFADFNLAPCGTQDCGQQFTNEVASTLSGSGLPVVSATNPALLAEGAGNQLQWWTPQAGVTFEGTTIQTLPINQNMYVPLGSTVGSDSSAFQTAIISATIHVGLGGGTITFGGDDDMFLALDNSVLGQVGGIHPAGTTDTVSVTEGTYFMQVFYADRHVTGASAFLDVGGDITTAVPEPSTWAMMILGFASVGFLAYRRNGKTALRLI